MPYVKQNRRTDTGAELPVTPGEFNYRISKLCDRMIAEHGLSYDTINGLIGAMECAKLELYRRVTVPYEDIKRIQNGEVYTASMGALKDQWRAFERSEARLAGLPPPSCS